MNSTIDITSEDPNHQYNASIEKVIGNKSLEQIVSKTF
jgi:hypothetical protein